MQYLHTHVQLLIGTRKPRLIFDIQKQLGESKLLVTVIVYILDRFHHARNGTKVRAIYKVTGRSAIYV